MRKRKLRQRLQRQRNCFGEIVKQENAEILADMVKHNNRLFSLVSRQFGKQIKSALACKPKKKLSPSFKKSEKRRKTTVLAANEQDLRTMCSERNIHLQIKYPRKKQWIYKQVRRPFKIFDDSKFRPVWDRKRKALYLWIGEKRGKDIGLDEIGFKFVPGHVVWTNDSTIFKLRKRV